MVALIVSSIPSQLRRHPLLPFFTNTRQASCSHFIARETEVGRGVEALGPGWLFLPLEWLQKLAAHPEWSGGGRATEPVSRSGGQGGVPSAGGLPATTPAHAPAAPCRCPPPPPRRPHTPAPRFPGPPAGRPRALSPTRAPVPRVRPARPRAAVRTPAVPARSPSRTSRPGTRAPPPPAAPPRRPQPRALARSARVPPGRAPTHRLPARPDPGPGPWAAPAAPAASRGALDPGRCPPPAVSAVPGAARRALAAGPRAAQRGAPSRPHGGARGARAAGWGCGRPGRAAPFPLLSWGLLFRWRPCPRASPLLQTSGLTPSRAVRFGLPPTPVARTHCEHH